ncbi:MAG: N-acetylmuramoyl-L-alanine amidase [Candidatus Melainabacteria bacterium]
MGTHETRLHVVYPQPGHTTHEDSTFFIGSAPPGWHLRCNDHPVSVTPDGYFTHQVALHDGKQTFTLTAQHGAQQETVTLAITRVTPYPVLSAGQGLYHRETLWPDPDYPIGIRAGDALTLRWSGNVDTPAILSIPGVVEGVAAKPVYPEAKTQTDGIIDNRQPVFREPHQTTRRIPRAGWMEATLTIPPGTPEQQTTIRLNGAVLYSDVSIWEAPRVAQISTPDTLSRPSPDSPDRLTPQPRRVTFSVDQQHSGWVRTHWGTQAVWHPEPDILWQPADNLRTGDLPTPMLLNTRVQAGPDGRLMEWTWSHLPPISVSEPDAETVAIRFITTDETQSFSLPRLCGYTLAAENNTLSLTLNTLPITPEQTRILIDPGHGGGETGTAGPNGLPEKTLNLTVANRLIEALRQAGFTVMTTRTNDHAVSLEDRATQASQDKAHLVISLHHNALPDGRNPAEHKGACCFWYHPHAKPLAEKLQQGLTALAGVNDYGVFEESFALTRITGSMAVLVEIGFFTDPAEFTRLIHPAFQVDMVTQLTQSLLQLFRRS